MKRILVVLLILATVFTGLFANGSSETVETKEVETRIAYNDHESCRCRWSYGPLFKKMG